MTLREIAIAIRYITVDRHNKVAINAKMQGVKGIEPIDLNKDEENKTDFTEAEEAALDKRAKEIQAELQLQYEEKMKKINKGKKIKS